MRPCIADQLCGGGDYSFGSCINESQGDQGDGPEKRYVWTAPQSGTYQFDSKTSQAITYLYARKNTCTGNELACSIDGPSNSRQAAITVDVDAGDRIVLFADLEYSQLGGYGRCEPDDGEFVLDITKQ